MTASAIQGDMEKCKKAGMDDYMAKPVKSNLLEMMLVRWSIQKRTGPTPQPSEVSECSHESGHCTTSGISCVGSEDNTPSGSAGGGLAPLPPPPPAGAAGPGGLEHRDSGSSLLTPRPRASVLQSPVQAPEQQQPQSPEAPARLELQVRRLESDELAQQGRDDKLIDAAGGAMPGVPVLHTPMSEKGDSLTEENVHKFIMEEELRRRRMS